MSRAGLRTEDELLNADVPDLVTTALQTADPARHLLVGAATPAALQVARAGARPRSLRFLAEIVRRGGIEVAAALPEPMPTPAQSAVVRPWLRAGHGDEHIFAGWLDAVAAIIETGPGAGGTGPGAL
jgi:hypothetical protein